MLVEALADDGVATQAASDKAREVAHEQDHAEHLARQAVVYIVSRQLIRSPTIWKASAVNMDLPIGRGSSAGAMSPSSTTILAARAAALRGRLREVAGCHLRRARRRGCLDRGVAFGA